MLDMLQPARITELCTSIHADNVKAGWWNDLTTGAPLKRNVGELLMLCVSEIAEAAEGAEFKLKDDKLTHLDMLDVELADLAIRAFDIAGGHKLDIAGAIQELGEAVDPDGCDHTGRKVMLGHDETVPEALMMLVRHISRAMEGHRKNKPDTLLPNRSAFEVGLAMAITDAAFISDMLGYDLNDTITQKRAFNATRADHKPENRMKADGKKY